MTQRRKTIRFSALLFLIGFWLSLFASEVKALTISPPRMEFSVNPGQTVEDVIKVFNETDTQAILFTFTQEFMAKEGEEGVPEFLAPGDKEGGLADWTEIERGPITILPREQKIIPFTLKVPSWADPGGHYAAIFFSTQAPERESGTVVGIAGRLGSLILLRVAGDIREEGELIEFNLKKRKRVYGRLPVDFVTAFQNSGNVHLKPQGEIVIKNIFGRTADRIEVNRRGSNVLPGTTRHFEASWTKTLLEKSPSGFWEELKAERDNFGLGRYRGELIIGYGAMGQKAQAKTFFWVLPWRLILLSFLGTALLIFLISVGIRRYNRWIVGKAMRKIS